MLLTTLLAMAVATLAAGDYVRPDPCVPLSPAPSEEETAQRFAEFAEAFIYDRDLVKSFEYISASYIVRVLREPGRRIPSTDTSREKSQPGSRCWCTSSMGYTYPYLGQHYRHPNQDYVPISFRMAELRRDRLWD